MIFFGGADVETMKRNKIKLYIIGGVMVLVGFLSMSMPLLASYAVETILGSLLLIAGLGQGFHVISSWSSGEHPWQQIILCVLSVMAGLVLLFHPLAGAATLGVILGVYFLMDGVTKIFEYFRLKEIKGSIWMLVNGLLGLFLAFLILKNFLVGAAILGIVLGINLIFSGVTIIFMAYHLPKN